MNAPQIILIVILSLELLVTANLHGELKTHTTVDFWRTFIIITGLIGLLLWGGFFAK